MIDVLDVLVDASYLVATALTVWALVEVVRAGAWGWLVGLLLWPVGVIAWFVAGRRFYGPPGDDDVKPPDHADDDHSHHQGEDAGRGARDRANVPRDRDPRLVTRATSSGRYRPRHGQDILHSHLRVLAYLKVSSGGSPM